jgi:hypothetical protein
MNNKANKLIILLCCWYAPQRHSNVTGLCGRSCPAESLISRTPSTLYGPFRITVMVGLFLSGRVLFIAITRFLGICRPSRYRPSGALPLQPSQPQPLSCARSYRDGWEESIWYITSVLYSSKHLLHYGMCLLER